MSTAAPTAHTPLRDGDLSPGGSTARPCPPSPRPARPWSPSSQRAVAGASTEEEHRALAIPAAVTRAALAVLPIGYGPHTLALRLAIAAVPAVAAVTLFGSLARSVGRLLSYGQDIGDPVPTADAPVLRHHENDPGVVATMLRNVGITPAVIHRVSYDIRTTAHQGRGPRSCRARPRALPPPAPVATAT